MWLLDVGQTSPSLGCFSSPPPLRRRGESFQGRGANTAVVEFGVNVFGGAIFRRENVTMNSKHTNKYITLTHSLLTKHATERVKCVTTRGQGAPTLDYSLDEDLTKQALPRALTRVYTGDHQGSNQEITRVYTGDHQGSNQEITRVYTGDHQGLYRRSPGI